MSTTITRSQLKLLIEDEHNIMVTEKENSLASKAGHAVLDVIGLVPGWGEYADVINAAAYAREGNYLLAALSAISVIPVIGDAVGKGGKVTLWLAKTFPKAAKQIKKYGPTLIKNVREIRDLIQLHDDEIKKFLKFVQENTADGSKIRPYLKDIEKAIDILGGKSGKSDEEVADLLQKEYSGTAVKPEMGNKGPDEKSAGLSIKIDKNQDGIPDSEQSQADLGKLVGSGNGAGGSQSSGMPFTTDGRMNPAYMNWENQKAANEIIAMIYEEAALVLEQKRSSKRSSNDITKSMIKEMIVEECQAQIMINEGFTSDALDDFIAQKICAKIGLAAPGDDPEDDALAIVSAEI